MIGTKVVIGFDGTQVMRGVASVGKAISKIGTTIGRGLFERIGQRMTDSIIGILRTIPDAVRETGDFAGEVYDLSRATGESAANIAKLGEMMRIGGAESVDAGRMLSTFGRNLNEAMTKGGAAADAFSQLGLTIADFEGKSFSEQLEMVMRTIGQSTLKYQELSQVVSDIFGGRAGYKMLAMMKDYDSSAARAGKTTAEWGEYLNKNAAGIDEMGDAMGRFRQLRMQVASNFFDQLSRLGGGSGVVDRLFDFLNAEKFRAFIQDIVSAIGRNLEALLQGDWKGMIGGLIKSALSGLGEMIVGALSALWEKIKEIAVTAGTMAGESFKKAVGLGSSGAGGSLGIGDIMGGIRGMFPSGKTASATESPATKRQMETLIKIEKDMLKQGNVAVWA